MGIFLQVWERSTDLSGQVALVRGAGRGLGRAFTQALAARGALVGITARSADELHALAADMPEGRVLAFPADVTDPAAAAEVVAAVERRLGPLTLLVNNAGPTHTTPQPEIRAGGTALRE